MARTTRRISKATSWRNTVRKSVTVFVPGWIGPWFYGRPKPQPK